MSENRYLITRIKKRNTLAGKPIVDLYAGGKDSRLRFPVLTLFDLSELAVVGIDPNDLDGQEVACRFWAYYTVGTKLNKDGNPYRDIDHLEAISAPTSGESANVEALYDELYAVKEELNALRAELAAVYTLLVERLAPGESPVAQPAVTETALASAKPVAETPQPETPVTDTPPAPTAQKATPTDFWSFAHSLRDVDDVAKKRLADRAMQSGNWTSALQELRAIAA
jgi:hypothetical protein